MCVFRMQMRQIKRNRSRFTWDPGIPVIEKLQNNACDKNDH